MVRTTVMADPKILAKLRKLAEQRGVSLAEVTREALEAKAAEYRPAPTCLGVGDSGKTDTSTKAGVGRTRPR